MNDIFELSKQSDTIALKKLIETDIDINRKDYGGHTALHWVCIHGNTGNLQLLLETKNIEIIKKDIKL